MLTAYPQTEGGRERGMAIPYFFKIIFATLTQQGKFAYLHVTDEIRRNSLRFPTCRNGFRAFLAAANKFHFPVRRCNVIVERRYYTWNFVRLHFRNRNNIHVRVNTKQYLFLPVSRM